MPSRHSDGAKLSSLIHRQSPGRPARCEESWSKLIRAATRGQESWGYGPGGWREPGIKLHHPNPAMSFPQPPNALIGRRITDLPSVCPVHLLCAQLSPTSERGVSEGQNKKPRTPASLSSYKGPAVPKQAEECPSSNHRG